jgi:transposase-like protein
MHDKEINYVIVGKIYCNSCKTEYSEKYKGRIESIKRRYEGKSEIEV